MAALASKGYREELADLNETRKAVENAESRARLEQRRTDPKAGRRKNQEFAKALHLQADDLYHSGDYETALVLYHRAANLFPQDSSHSVAARRTVATISSCNNPSKALRKAVASAKIEERLTVNLCPETAAIHANERLKKSPDPQSVVEVLSYFDNHKSFWKALPSPRLSNVQLARSKMMLRQLNNLANGSLESLEGAFNSGKMSAALKIAQELLMLSAGFQDPSRYQIAAYHYLSLIHVALGRHDRAVCSVSRLIRLAKSTGDVLQICRSLVTLGKVHLSFGHLHAAAKAWEHLSSDLNEPIPTAWIRHEIGRCHLETGKHRQALEMGSTCLEAATEGNSKKWMLHGRLLLGQSLAKMGRFVEALEELQIAAKITEEEGDTPMLSYIRDLIDQVTRALRRIAFEMGHGGADEPTVPSRSEKDEDSARQSGPLVSRPETIITTMFSQRKVIAAYSDGGGSSTEASVDVDEEITMHSGNTRSVMQSYRESTARSGLHEEQEDLVFGGSSTFRVGGLETVSLKGDVSPSSTSSSSASSCSSFDDKGRPEEVDDIDGDWQELEGKAESNIEEEGGPRASETSMTTVNTTATYVIKAEEGVPRRTRLALVDDQQEGISRVSDKDRRGTGQGVKDDAASDKASDEREGMLNALRVIEELKSNEDEELLAMVRDMMLAADPVDRSRDPGNSGDADRENFGTPRSSVDGKLIRTLYKQSVPPSPRKCDADGDFRGCGATMGSN